MGDKTFNTIGSIEGVANINKMVKEVINTAKALTMVLESPEKVPGRVGEHAIGLAQKLVKADNLLVDKVLNQLMLSKKHLVDIKKAVDNGLFDDVQENEVKQQSVTLIESLLEHWDVLVEKMQQDGYFYNTFGRYVNDIHDLIGKILENIPVGKIINMQKKVSVNNDVTK